MDEKSQLESRRNMLACVLSAVVICSVFLLDSTIYWFLLNVDKFMSPYGVMMQDR